MEYISSLTINGFRRLCDVDIKLSNFNVLIGANGVGKTSFLDALALISASASGGLTQGISDMGGINSILTKDGRDYVSMAVKMPTQGYEPLEYNLSLARTAGGGFIISEERLAQRQKKDSPIPFLYFTKTAGEQVKYYNTEEKKLQTPSWDYDYNETALYQVPKMYSEAEDFRKILASTARYHVLDVSSRAPIKLPQQLKPATMPGADGETMFPFLYNLRENNPERYNTLLDMLKVAFKSFEGLSYPSVAAGIISLQWKDKTFKDPLFMNEMSEGTLRFLWLLSLLYSDNLPTITMIDEPEVSLHPEMLMLLTDALRDASNRTQIIVATHSDRLIRFLKPEEIITMDIDESGYACMNNAVAAYDLELWLRDYGLDEIWDMGLIGGRS